MLDLRPLKIVVTGASGFVGRHLVAALKARGCEDIRTPPHKFYSLIIEDDAYQAIRGADVVFHLAAKCGGIGANQAKPAEFVYDNLAMGLNVIDACHNHRVKKLVMLGTLCAYPQNIPGPIEPSDLWNGYPEPTNAPYGIAKRTLVEVGKAYHSQYGLNVVNVMPANMYGPSDNFDPETSHVIPAMIRRFAEAKQSGASSVTCWGTGSPTRDFLHVSDACEGIIRAAEWLNDPEPVNLGTGAGVSMATLAETIAEAVGYTGEICWDASRPDGQPNRVVSTGSQRERLGLEPAVKLLDGLRETVEWWRTNGDVG